MKTALTIAGSDSSGGAGIQADIKTMTMHGVFAMSVITSITAQNTREITAIENTSAYLVEKQLDAVFQDIFPDAVKIGLIPNIDLIHVVARKLKLYQAKNIVFDPLMVSTSGSRLMDENCICTLLRELIPFTDLITPNIPEAEILSGRKIDNIEEMEVAGNVLFSKLKVPVLIKGGHLKSSKVDILLSKDGILHFEGESIDNPNTHGTGCTLSSAIAANLALGKDLKTSVKEAKDYVAGAISDGLDLGRGTGPLNHMYQNFNRITL